jgi:hypothetical protein
MVRPETAGSAWFGLSPAIGEPEQQGHQPGCKNSDQHAEEQIAPKTFARPSSHAWEQVIKVALVLSVVTHFFELI